MDRLLKLLGESIGAAADRQKQINDAVRTRWQKSRPASQLSPSEQPPTELNGSQQKQPIITEDMEPPSPEPIIVIRPPSPRKTVVKRVPNIPDMVTKLLQFQHKQLIGGLKSLAIESKLTQLNTNNPNKSPNFQQSELTIEQTFSPTESSPKQKLIRKLINHRKKQQSPKKQEDEQLKAKNIELLREAQKKRYELLQKLRKLDHKVEVIKKTELSNSRVSNNSKEHHDYQHSSSNGKSEREKHEEAIRLIKKINDEKHEREERKLRELQRARVEKQAQLEAMLLSKQMESRNRKDKLLVRQSAGPHINTISVRANQLSNKGNSQSTGGLETLERANNLPAISAKLKRNDTLVEPRKRFEKLDVQVTVDLTKRSFPKSRVHQLIVQEERQYKNRELRDQNIKIEQLQRRNNYTVGGKQKVVLTPISLSSSVSEQRSNALRAMADGSEEVSSHSPTIGVKGDALASTLGQAEAVSSHHTTNRQPHELEHNLGRSSDGEPQLGSPPLPAADTNIEAP